MAITGSGMVNWAQFWFEISGLALIIVLGYVIFWMLSLTVELSQKDDKGDERDSHEVL